MKEYFKVLGLSENASYEQVKSARIKLLKKYHPDLYSGNKKIAEMKAIEINQAFDMLSKYFENSRSNQEFEQFKEVNEQKVEDDINKKKAFEEKSNLNIKSKKNKNKDTDLTDENERDKKGKKLLDILIYILIIILICLLVVLIAT